MIRSAHIHAMMALLQMQFMMISDVFLSHFGMVRASIVLICTSLWMYYVMSAYDPRSFGRLFTPILMLKHVCGPDLILCK